MRRALPTPAAALVVSLLLASAAAATHSPSQSPPPSKPPQSPAAGFDVVEATIQELQEAMASGQVTAVDLVDAYLARIAAYDQAGPELNAILSVNPRAREVAAALDEERRFRGPRGPLHGIPVILKDNYNTADMPTSGSSIALAGFIPAMDAFQVRKLRDAGAVILAKSNMHELAMGITTISSFGAQTRNPYDRARNPGGSSGGTGAAVAASYAAVGMGSDTCGSIRIPSSHNNLVGLRPTKGLSSVAGVLPLSHTQDVAGPLARTASDLAIVLDATVGPDPGDPATLAFDGQELPSFTDALSGASLQGARFGRLAAYFEDAEDAVAEVIDAAIEEMEQMGAEVIEIEVPGMGDLLRKSGVINYEFKFDFLDYLAQNPGAPIGSLSEILEQGLHHEALRRSFERRDRLEERDSDEYRAALAWRPILRTAVVQILDENRLDAIIYPTMLRRPSRIGEPQSGSTCSLSANSGLPALSLPAGFTADGLPVGLELLGPPLGDADLVAHAYAFERGTDHRRAPAMTPPLVDGAAPRPVSFRVPLRASADPGHAAGSDEEAVPATEESKTAIGELSFTFDPLRNTLAYALQIFSVPRDEIHAVLLHRGESGEGPAIARLSGPGAARARGVVDLSPTERQALEDGELAVRVYTRRQPTGAARGRLVLPQ